MGWSVFGGIESYAVSNYAVPRIRVRLLHFNPANERPSSTQKPALTNRSPRSTFKVRSVNEGDLSAHRLAEEVAGDADQDGQLRRPALWNPVQACTLYTTPRQGPSHDLALSKPLGYMEHYFWGESCLKAFSWLEWVMSMNSAGSLIIST
jgi:hypothetical protein